MTKKILIALFVMTFCMAAAFAAENHSGVIQKSRNPHAIINPVDSNKDGDITCLMIQGGHSNDLEFTRSDFLAHMTGFAFDVFDCNYSTPTVEQLLGYDVVLLWENGIFPNAPNVGNVIYDYVVNNNGNVVFATFIWQDWSTWGGGYGYGWGSMEDICPMYETGGCSYYYENLNPSSIVAHPVTEGVSSLWVDSYGGGTSTNAGATELGTFDSGSSAIAINEDLGGRMVAISVFPSYGYYGSYGSNYGGDFYKLFENALIWAGAGMEEVSLTMTPLNPPVIIPPQGGKFKFTADVTNNTTQTQQIQAWIDVVLPNGSTYGPVFGPFNFNLPGNGHITKTLTQSVPGGAPAGSYDYCGHIVYTTGTDDACFDVVKQ